MRTTGHRKPSWKRVRSSITPTQRAQQWHRKRLGRPAPAGKESSLLCICSLAFCLLPVQLKHPAGPSSPASKPLSFHSHLSRLSLSLSLSLAVHTPPTSPSLASAACLLPPLPSLALPARTHTHPFAHSALLCFCAFVHAQSASVLVFCSCNHRHFQTAASVSRNAYARCISDV